MRFRTGLSLRSFAALVAAAALAAAGMWLAVGAGARDEGGARALGYPITYAFKMHIDGGPGKINSTTSRKAKFRFHVTYNPRGQVPRPVRRSLKYKCKLDRKDYGGCSSPEKYRHLDKGKHKFRVKAVYKASRNDASKPAKYRWKVK
jgi:hypothetical protein